MRTIHLDNDNEINEFIIENLKEENKQTKLLKDRYQLEKENYKLRIDKAIEYIENHFEEEYKKPKEELKNYNLKNCTYDASLVVLDILKGVNNE